VLDEPCLTALASRTREDPRGTVAPLASAEFDSLGDYRLGLAIDVDDAINLPAGVFVLADYRTIAVYLLPSQPSGLAGPTTDNKAELQEQEAKRVTNLNVNFPLPPNDVLPPCIDPVLRDRFTDALT
jgi:hypothetical protein